MTYFKWLHVTNFAVVWSLLQQPPPSLAALLLHFFTSIIAKAFPKRILVAIPFFTANFA